MKREDEKEITVLTLLPLLEDTAKEFPMEVIPEIMELGKQCYRMYKKYVEETHVSTRHLAQLQKLEHQVQWEKERGKNAEQDWLTRLQTQAEQTVLLHQKLLAQQDTFTKAKEALSHQLRLEWDEEQRRNEKKAGETLEKMKSELAIRNKEMDQLRQEGQAQWTAERQRLEAKHAEWKVQMEASYHGKLLEKEKQVATIVDHWNQEQSHLSKSSVRGSRGEKQMEEFFKDVFKDFQGFYSEDKHAEASAGDFHLHFQEFSVLVDVKNYTGPVPKRERDKLHRDLEKHPQLHFAWLVSLQSGVERFDSMPITIEWVNSRQCVLYVNRLFVQQGFEEANSLVRLAWIFCKNMLPFFAKEEREEEREDDDEHAMDVVEDRERLTLLQTKWQDGFNKIRGFRKMIAEMTGNVVELKKKIDLLDEGMKDWLQQETQTMVDNPGIVKVEEWLRTHLKPGTDPPSSAVGEGGKEKPVSGLSLWYALRKRFPEICKQKGQVDLAKFKQMLQVRIPKEQLVVEAQNIKIYGFTLLCL